MAGRDVLRALWSAGLRVVKRPDGSLSLAPSDRVTPDLVRLARDAKAEIEAVVADLPAVGRRPICGDSGGYPDKAQAHCTTCAPIAAERLGLTHDISGMESCRAA